MAVKSDEHDVQQFFIIFPQNETYTHSHNHSESIMKVNNKSIALNLNKATS